MAVVSVPKILLKMMMISVSVQIVIKNLMLSILTVILAILAIANSALGTIHVVIV